LRIFSAVKPRNVHDRNHTFEPLNIQILLSQTLLLALFSLESALFCRRHESAHSFGSASSGSLLRCRGVFLYFCKGLTLYETSPHTT
jgi:hypothetical protein